ncbi:MAG TPA: hypothetical protein VFG33_09710 [Kribbella sp.]|nr:hypothetical protein [Kribbella sp.]HET6293642.1 hypothetical protein [Kribbella sp.]
MSDPDYDRLGELVAELAVDHDPITEEELARACAEWPANVWAGGADAH